jgi:anti-sigma B factor antagonist
LSMSSRPVGSVVVVQCSGRIVAGAELFSLQAHIGDVLPKHCDVVLGLDQVTFIDSSGLGALVRMVSSARAKGGDIKLSGLQQHVRKTLEMTNLLSLFEIYDSEAEAILAAYLGSRYSKEKSSDVRFRVLCVYDSVEVCAFLSEVLCRAGYNALTTGNVADAKLLLRAINAKLIILGGSMQTVHGKSTRKIFEEIDPSVSLVVLDQDFDRQDPGECITKLLENIRSVSGDQSAHSNRSDVHVRPEHSQ